MGQSLYVGHEAGLIDFSDVMEVFEPGDVIMMMPSAHAYHYKHSELVIRKDEQLVIMGTADPTDVTISTGFTVYGDLTLENITLDFSDEAYDHQLNVIHGSLTLKNVRIIKNKTGNPVLADTSRIIARNVMIDGINMKDSFSIINSDVFIEYSEFDNFMAESSRVTINHSTVHQLVHMDHQSVVQLNDVRITGIDDYNAVMCKRSELVLNKVRIDNADTKILSIYLSADSKGLIKDSAFLSAKADRSELLVVDSIVTGFMQVTDRGKLKMKSVIVEGHNQFFPVFASNSYLTMEAVKLFSKDKKIYTIKVIDGTRAKITECLVSNVGINNSNVTIEQSVVHYYLDIQNNSDVSVKNSAVIGDSRFNPVMGRKSMIKLYNVRIKDDDHALYSVSLKEKSKVEITGSNFRNIMLNDSMADVRDSKLDGVFEILNHSMFIGERIVTEAVGSLRAFSIVDSRLVIDRLTAPGHLNSSSIENSYVEINHLNYREPKVTMVKDKFSMTRGAVTAHEIAFERKDEQHKA